MDTQDEKPYVAQSLERVGITNLKTQVKTKWQDKEYIFSPKTQITIDLPSDKKGVHMSRLIEAITEAVEEETQKQGRSLEQIEKNILENLAEKHPYNKGEIRFTTDLFIEKKTPSTGKKTIEASKVSVTVIKENGSFKKKLMVEVLGNTVCPHSLVTCGNSHMQRAIAKLWVSSDFDNIVELEHMIDCVERSFSSEVYTLLKSEDEAKVVQKMCKNPKFVEDVVREILDNAKKKFIDCKIRAKVTSQESIHRHDVIAEGTG